MTDRASAWIDRLATSCVPAVQAHELYSGEHWDLARRLLTSTSLTNTLELWVCSAGYGLVPATASLRPYAATFAAGSHDTVPGDTVGARAWWECLSAWPGPSTGPRTITSLVEEDPGARVIVCLSAAYLQACAADITRALEASSRTGQLSIISSGTRTTRTRLDEAILPTDARLQAALGGTRRALNVRILHHLLAVGAVQHQDMGEVLTTLLATQPPIPRYERRQATDQEVRSFIATQLALCPDATRSTLLRMYRDGGHACEQRRFAALFDAEKRGVA